MKTKGYTHNYSQLLTKYKIYRKAVMEGSLMDDNMTLLLLRRLAHLHKSSDHGSVRSYTS